MFPLRDTIPSRSAPLMSVTLIAACVGAFLYEISLPEKGLVRLFYQYGVVPARPVFFYASIVEIPAVLYLGIWAMSQVWNGTWALASAQAASGVAWWAHVGGFAAGLLLHRFFLRPGRRR